MNKNLLIGILAVVVIIIAAVAYLTTQQPPAPTQTTTNQPPATPTTPTPTPTPTQTTPTPSPTTQPTTPTPTTTPTTPSPTPTTTAPPPAQKVTIKIWHALNPEEEAVFKEIAALYTQSHPNVQVIFENKAPDLQTAVLAAISTGEKFDLFIWAHDWIGLMVEAGVL
ncbi:MAG: extracellular solute-binding protein, partial [Pyrobaculum sp.]|nr:extracellular solute-binding protein [Pyrobaculum sp.]